MTNKALDLKACKVFVCPNLNLLDIKGKEIGLSEKAIQKSKEVAVTYLKATYHSPKYGSIKSLLPVFTYIAAASLGEGRTQHEIVSKYGSTEITFRKWYREISEKLNMHVMVRGQEKYVY